MDVRVRLLIAAFVAGLIALVLPDWIHVPTRSLFIWDVGMFSFLGLTWWIMLRATPATMRRKAQQQDIGRLVILGILTAIACISVLAIGLMLRDSKQINTNLLLLHLALGFFTIVGSWLLVHTIFAAHYAYGYYEENPGTSPEQDQQTELDFPGDIEPDYWDFLYFSFVIGMTSQVSDVQILSRSLRRLALLHGVLSFFFNTMILAMSINIIAGLIQNAN